MWENAYLSIKKPKKPAADCLLRSHDSTSLHQQLLASEPGPPLTKSWICTCWLPGGSLLRGVCRGGSVEGVSLCPGGSVRSVHRGVFVWWGLSGRPPMYSKERAVRMLLECILVRYPVNIIQRIADQTCYQQTTLFSP